QPEHILLVKALKGTGGVFGNRMLQFLEDKEYGYIVDYRDLFKKLEHAVTEYTSGAFEGFDKEDVLGLLKDWLEEGKKDLEEALETIHALCEPVAPPKDSATYIRYFCDDVE